MDHLRIADRFSHIHFCDDGQGEDLTRAVVVKPAGSRSSADSSLLRVSVASRQLERPASRCACQHAAGRAPERAAERARGHPPEGRKSRMPIEPPTGEQARFFHLLMRDANVQLEDFRSEPLLRRLPACLRVLGTASLAEAERIIRFDPDRRRMALDALLIGTSAFFRDRPVFDRLRPLLAGLLDRRDTISIWSAGCSDGMELASIAMFLDDFGALDRARLLGTDCRASAIRKARNGEYDARLTAIPADVQGRVTVRQSVVRLSQKLRGRMRFDRVDLLSADPAGPFDLILCRNVAIYLVPQAVERLWARLIQALSPGGYLVTGKAERIRAHSLTRVAPSIYRSSGGVFHEA